MAKKVVGEAIKENRNASVFMKNLGYLTDQEARFLASEFANLGIETREVENLMRIAKGEIEEGQEYISASREMQELKVELEKKVDPKKVNLKSIEENKGVVKQETKPKKPLDLSTLGEEELEAIKQCIEFGLIENLVKVPEDKRKKMLIAINNSLNERIKGNPISGIPEGQEKVKMEDQSEEIETGDEIGD